MLFHSRSLAQGENWVCLVSLEIQNAEKEKPLYNETFACTLTSSMVTQLPCLKLKLLLQCRDSMYHICIIYGPETIVDFSMLYF